MLKNISRNGVILGAFTLATTALISITFWLTQPVIERQQQQKILEVLGEVLPSNKWDNDLANNCIIVDDSLLGKGLHRIYRAWLGDKPSALILESTTPKGYSGNIKYLVSVIDNNLIGGVRVLEHRETPGLGDKIELRISDWILSFNNRALLEVQESNWGVKKDGGKFDQFTGATITPRAMVNGVSDTALWAKENYQKSFEAENACADIESLPISSVDTADTALETGGHNE